MACHHERRRISQAQGGARDLPRCGPCGTLCGLALTFASTRIIVLRHLGSVIFGSIVVAIARLIMIVVCSSIMRNLDNDFPHAAS